MTWDKMTERERDCLVAKGIMGWTNIVELEDEYNHETTSWKGLPPNSKSFSLIRYYTKSISDSWEVVEKMDEGGYMFRLSRTDYGWRASFLVTEKETDTGLPEDIGTNIRESSVPEAICKASLKARGVKL